MRVVGEYCGVGRVRAWGGGLVRIGKANLQNKWLRRYAEWEEKLQEFRRARSVFERAIEIDYKNPSLWLKYAEMEMRHKFVNHARNVFERAITYLPRIDQFWYKYAYMEEILGNYVKARQIFERWMEWKPDEKAWKAYMAFEKRMKEDEKCRNIMFRMMESFPNLKTYMMVAQQEVKSKNVESARKIYEKTLEELGESALKEDYFINFAKFEISQKQHDRAREIFRFGLKQIPKEHSIKLYKEYLAFEKQFGQKDEIDELVFNQRRTFYKDIIAKNQLNYDAWFDLVNLEIAAKSGNLIRETFEAAIKNVPLIEEKRYWRRYIYLWYSYAIYEELDAANMKNAAKIYERAIQLIPHQKFTFSKLWIQYAQLYVRCQDLDKARKIMGIAIGKCPNEKLFQAYIELELQLGNIDRVRKLYEKFADVMPQSPIPWIKWAELEKSIGETERYRAIFDLGIENTAVEMPEVVWRAYINNEIE